MSKRLRKSSPAGPTLGDVARAAGVSTATVSRVINRPDAVRPELRDRVRRQIDALGYVADGAARALASRRSRTIGAVIPTLSSAIFSEGIDAFETALGGAGYSLVLATSGYDAGHEARHIRNLVERGVDALLLVGRIHDADAVAMLERRGVPFVETWTYRPDSPNACVGFDNHRAAKRMAAHLVDLGHRDIAMIAGLTHGNDRAMERVSGVHEALAEAGIELPAERFMECA
ncbi:MAG: LacI family DNA-binding transcriptional regulator, partial [Magnetovibrio sp.]|nr:LacI family DNA-binding transcriptional regulator [Magnetovibrio sp.]